MSKSLQDQLLGAGLVDKKKATQISKQSRKSKNEKRRSKDDSLSEAQVAAKKALEEKQLRDRELNQKREQEANKKATAAQVKQLVQHYKIKRSDSDLTYNFSDQQVVKSIRVDKRTSDEIVRGRLCIVRVGENYEIIPKPIADKVIERDASAVVVYNQTDTNESAKSLDEDEAYYAQFEIPDDLVW